LEVVLLDVADPWVRWGWIANHRGVIQDAALQHIQLTAIAVLGGLLIATPVGLAAWRWRPLRNPVLGVSGILYTIPSLALFAMLVPFTGLSVVTAEIGLIGYTLLILVRNIVVGLDGVPADVREAATGMGYRPFKRLLTVDIPLALPVIVAGLRIATVTTIGLVTVTALLGQGGLGQLILAGLIQDFKTPLVVGAAGSVLLAVAADLLLAGAQRLATPWRSAR
jgi:osmoprotectant transport system permease protein